MANGSKASKVRERLLAGEALAAEAIQEEYEVGVSYVGQIVAELRRKGYNILTERVEGVTTYRLGEGEPPARVERKAKPVPIPTLPMLGTDLTVRGLFLQDDGSVMLGLKNGKTSWLVKVEGLTTG